MKKKEATLEDIINFVNGMKKEEIVPLISALSTKLLDIEKAQRVSWGTEVEHIGIDGDVEKVLVQVELKDGANKNK